MEELTFVEWEAIPVIVRKKGIEVTEVKILDRDLLGSQLIPRNQLELCLLLKGGGHTLSLYRHFHHTPFFFLERGGCGPVISKTCLLAEGPNVIATFLVI